MQSASYSAAFALALVFIGCTASSTTTSPPEGAPAAAADPADPGDPGASAGADPDAGAASACAPPPSKSGCKNESSWVRGIAHFDPAHFAGGKKPVLRAVLRHGFALVKGEDAIGGRLHAWTSIPVDDPSKGEVPFAIDMCSLGTAMWSEENGAFHLVLILDEDGNNDLDQATSNEDAIAIGTPGPNELVKMVDVDVSCHAASACLDVSIDCTGAACTKITPITSCRKKTPGCASESIFCK